VDVTAEIALAAGFGGTRCGGGWVWRWVGRWVGRLLGHCGPPRGVTG
jgi:hypothetical protein